MATAAEIALLREYIDDVDAPQTYTDTQLGDKIDRVIYVECAAAEVWRIKAGKLVKDAALKKLKAGIEDVEYETLINQQKAALSLGDYYGVLCDKKTGVCGSRMIRVNKPDVGNILSSDTIDQIEGSL
jgi:hypothetical protein